jgi:hypothetical protein
MSARSYTSIEGRRIEPQLLQIGTPTFLINGKLLIGAHLAPRELPRPVTEPLGEPDAVDERDGSSAPFGCRHSAELHRQHNVFNRGEIRDQVEGLEHEAHRL